MDKKSLTEADICAKFITSALVGADGGKWNLMTQIREQVYFTRGRVTECNLHTIVRLPNGVFNPYTGIRTNLLFFTKGTSTREIWYYEHPYPPGAKSYNKGKPIQIAEFDPEKAWWGIEKDGFKTRVENERAWRVPIDRIRAGNFNLDLKNPPQPGYRLSRRRTIIGRVRATPGPNRGDQGHAQAGTSSGTMPDDLDQYFQCVEAKGRWEFQVGVVSWVDGPHSPRLVWKSYRKWTKPPTTERLARAKAAALNDARLFRVCTRCRQWHNSGHMFDMETCRSCASCLFGILY